VLTDLRQQQVDGSSECWEDIWVSLIAPTLGGLLAALGYEQVFKRTLNTTGSASSKSQ